MPMFPLGTVLVPHAVLPLHVFEPRYRVLMFDSLLGNREFGVVLIERGSEVGGADQRFGVATVAHIAEASELPDGRWVVLAVGTRRVDVADWLPDAPYPVALIEERADVPWPDVTDEGDALDRAIVALASAERSVRLSLGLAAELGDEAPSALVELSSDPAVAAWQLLAVAPIGALDKQRLLAIDDHAERLGQLAAVAEDQAFLLAYRLNRE
ncbi:MAG: LON peptidase substrate-binding domain-containing protein [Actinomycetota bacterium]|nr:LON peptidase substrate-binding domain-containing protein [Actinomycetota bacterium]